MNAEINIRFCPPNLGNFDDQLTIISELTSIQIPLQGRRKPPKLTLPFILEAPPCWAGTKSDISFKCQNIGGEGAFKFFCEKDEDDSKQDIAESVKVFSDLD